MTYPCFILPPLVVSDIVDRIYYYLYGSFYGQQEKIHVNENFFVHPGHHR